MDKKIYNCYLAILKSELIIALGCTEPIAIAYAAAMARKVLGAEPDHCEVSCSGNIIKNVKGVTVPNSGGQKGIVTAAILGVVGGDADKELAVLEGVTDEDRMRTKKLCKTDFCSCKLIEGTESLHIIVELTKGNHKVLVELKQYHTNITRIVKDSKELPVKKKQVQGTNLEEPDKSQLNLEGILEFADEINIADVEEIIANQISYNTALSEEGMQNSYGAEIGRTMLKECDKNDIRVLAQAYAAAGSDARMSGCPMAAVINSGSGNQGITVTMPVVKYADFLQVSRERLYRSLVVANLVAIHQKRFIGNLSAYCGAVSAACGAGSGIAYMQGYGLDVIAKQITNTIATIGGMVCDGAKASCAAKISAAVNVSLLGLQLAIDNHSFSSGEGLVKDDVEQTIRSIGRMGRVGMKSTDIEILNIMLEN